MTRIVPHLLFAASSLLAADALDHTKWTVRAAQPAELWPKSARGTLTFDGGRASFSGCNMTTGKYEIKDARLSAQFLMSTKRACQPELETASQNFIAALGAGGTFQIQGDNLKFDAGEKGSWTLLKLPMASKDAVTKFLYVASERAACPGDSSKMCLQIREKPEDAWQATAANIIGFTPRPGIEYRVRIKEDSGPSGPVWYHDMTVEQKVIKR